MRSVESLCVASEPVDVWTVDLDDACRDEAEALTVLSAQERERVALWADPQDRGRRTVGRAALRAILGRYLGRPAAAVPLTAGPFGKPLLATDGPRFSLSHDGALAVVAVTERHAAIGVDVERIGRRGPDRLPRRALVAREAAALDVAPPSAREALFLRYWTAKEAVAKACGTGLGLDPRTIEVAHGHARRGDRRWTLAHFDAAPSAVACVAVPEEA